MAGSIPPGMSQDNMKQQAQHIWSMLDDMANNDPASYKKFIDKQVKEGKESMKLPEPHMCVQTTIKDSQEDYLFINVFEWQRVPNPKDDEAPIPVLGGPIIWGKDENGNYRTAAVAFNPKVLEEFGLNSKLLAERRLLINLAIDYIQDQHKLDVSRNYTLLNKSQVCKGSVQLSRQSLMKKTEEKDEEFEKQLSDLEKTFGPMAEGCKSSLLNQLSNLTTTNSDMQQEPDTIGKMTSANQSEIRMPGSVPQPKLGLVQEISDSGEAKDREPLYDLQMVTEEEGKGKIILKVQLPGVASVSECELDISQDDVHLVVPHKYDLQLSLPQTTDENNATAKFSRKSSTLTLRLTVS